jgi:hypothetical protein
MGQQMGQGQLKSVKSIIVGIDPGRQTGVALYDQRKKKILSVHTLTFWEFLSGFRLWMSLGIKGVVMENPNLNRPVFMSKEDKESFSNAIESCNHDNVNSIFRIYMKRAQNVGQNKQITTHILEFLDQMKIPVTEIKPSVLTRKVNAAQFKEITGFEGRTNEHTRDAGRLVWGL